MKAVAGYRSRAAGVKALLEEGLERHSIARRLGISHDEVRDAVKTLRRRGIDIESGRNGRPRNNRMQGARA